LWDVYRNAEQPEREVSVGGDSGVWLQGELEKGLGRSSGREKPQCHQFPVRSQQCRFHVLQDAEG
jgi:hypothetical protein